MKNSVETSSGSSDTDSAVAGSSVAGSGKTGFSLFAIDEHRLSVGLLVLLLLSAAAYGLWMVMSPFLPASVASFSNVSRKEQAEIHYGAKEWNDAIQIYRQMLVDDPDNGFATQRLALARERQMFAKWTQYKDIGKSDGSNSENVDELLSEESAFCEAAIDRWNELLDNARYERLAYERIATIYSLRSKYMDKPEDIEVAIQALDTMFENGHTTTRGLAFMARFRPLRDHPEFSRLVRDEESNSNFGTDSQFQRRGQLEN